MSVNAQYGFRIGFNPGDLKKHTNTKNNNSNNSNSNIHNKSFFKYMDIEMVQTVAQHVKQSSVV